MGLRLDRQPAGRDDPGHRRRGVGILLIEQFTTLALSLARTALVLERGGLVFAGASEELRRILSLHGAYLASGRGPSADSAFAQGAASKASELFDVGGGYPARGASGIGLASAEGMADNGVRVALLDVDRGGLDAAIAKLNAKAAMSAAPSSTSPTGRPSRGHRRRSQCIRPPRRAVRQCGY